MDLNRLYSIVLDINIDEKEFNIEEFLAEVLAGFKDSMTNDASTIKLDVKINDFFKINEKSLINAYHHSNKQLLNYLGGEDFFGEGLKKKINQLLSSNFSPAKVLKELETFIAKRKGFMKKIQSFNSLMKEFDIEAEYYGDEFEIGIIIPSDDRFGNLKAFEKVIHQWNFILKTFNEIIANDTSEIEIQSISNGSLQLFITDTFEVAESIIKVLGKTTTLYLTLKGLNSHLEALKVSKLFKKSMPSFQEVKKEKVNEEIEGLKKEILNKYGKEIEAGRKAELTVALDKSLRLIIKYVDDGIILEINPPYVGEAEDIKDTDSDAEKIDKTEQIKKRSDLAKKVEIIKKSSEALSSIIDLSKTGFKLLEEKIDEEDVGDITTEEI